MKPSKLYPFLLLLMVVVLSACDCKQEKTNALPNRQVNGDSLTPPRHPMGASDTMTAYRRQWQASDSQARRRPDVKDDTSYQDNKKLEIYMEAKTWISVGNYDKAIEWYKLFENYQENQDVLCKIAECYAMKGDPDKAFEFIDKFYELLEKTINEMASSPMADFRNRYPNPTVMRSVEFNNLHSDPRWKQVETKASEFIQRIVSIQQQYHDKARQDAQASVKIELEQMERVRAFRKLYSIVDSLEQIGKFDQAIKLCKDATGVQEFHTFWYLLGRLYAEKQDKDQAFACLNKAFKFAGQQNPRGILPSEYDRLPLIYLISLLNEENYFDNLHSDPRWSDIDKKIKEGQNR